MALRDVLALAWRNYLWPTLYAAAAAVAVVAEQQLTTGQGFDAHSLQAAGIGAALTFIASRLNPYAGKHEPIVDQHK